MMIFGATIVLLMCTIFAYVYGQAYATKDALRHRADAIVLAAAEAFRKYGPAEARGDVCDAVRSMLEPGEGCPELIEVPPPNSGYRIVWPPGGGVVTRSIDVPLGLFDTRQVQLTASAESFAAEKVITEVEERRPKFVMVLDYSGSMSHDFSGDTRIGALKAAVNGILAENFNIDYAVVLFESGLRGSVGFGANNVRAIRDMVNSNDPGGATNYTAGMQRAHQFLRNQEDTGLYVLFASDGAPNPANENGRNQANAMWNEGITTMTLNIGAGPGQRPNLIAISGRDGERANPDYMIEAATADALVQAFEDIVGSIVCRAVVPPDLGLRGSLDEPRGLIVARRDRQTDREKAFIFWSLDRFTANPNNKDRNGDLRLDRDGRPYEIFTLFQENARTMVKLNQAACAEILAGRADIVMRATRPALVSR